MPSTPKWSEKYAVMNHVVVPIEFAFRKKKMPHCPVRNACARAQGTVCATLDTNTFRLNAVRDVCRTCDWIQLPSMRVCVSCSQRRRLQCLNEMPNIRNTCDEPTIIIIIMCALRREWKCVSTGCVCEWMSICLCLSICACTIFIQHSYSIPAQAAQTPSLLTFHSKHSITIVLLRRGRAAVRMFWALLFVS